MRSDPQPRSRSPGCWPLYLLFVALLPVAAHGAADPDAPKAWLEKMVRAAQTLNYIGTFVYRDGNWMETMRIVHRADESGERERLVSLSGSVREVVRDENRVTCILPDTRSVVVGKSKSRSLLPRQIFSAEDGFSRYYELSARPGARVAGRHTRRLVIDAKDEYRYGYHLWVDEQTGLLLRSELYGDDAEEPLEQLVYTSIELPDHIPDRLLEPSISGQGFTWYTNEDPGGAEEALGEARWQVGWLPEGFVLRERNRDPVPTSRMPVEHLWYSDGIASLSIFIEPLEQGAAPLRGPSNMGAVNAYGRVLDGYQVTVVGEVPARTVKKVSESLARE